MALFLCPILYCTENRIYSQWNWYISYNGGIVQYSGMAQQRVVVKNGLNLWSAWNSYNLQCHSRASWFEDFGVSTNVGVSQLYSFWKISLHTDKKDSYQKAFILELGCLQGYEENVSLWEYTTTIKFIFKKIEDRKLKFQFINGSIIFHYPLMPLLG
jgi:hypothetical protein